MSSDGAHMVIPSSDPVHASRAIAAALADAAVSPDEIDYVNAHAAGTPVGDVAEAGAIRMALGDATDGIPVSSTKSMSGHMISGAAAFDGYTGVVSAAQREEFNAGINPITLGSIGWRGTGALWSSNNATATQQLTGLPPHGAGDVLMFVLDPATARLWIGKNGIWRDDPASGAATWTAAVSTAFYPQIHGRTPGDGGTLRSLPAQCSYPVPPGVQALAAATPDLSVFAAAAFLEIGWSAPLSLAEAAVWISRGGARHLSPAAAAGLVELGGATGLTLAQATLYIEVDLP
jgi:hypothetical protein